MGNLQINTPRYGGHNICNILPSIASFNKIKFSDGLKRHTLDSSLNKRFASLLQKTERIVILKVDAFGFDLMKRVRGKYSFLKNVIKIDSVFPTYTHTAFASFITGTPPSSHGLLAGTFKIGDRVDWVGNLSKEKKHFGSLIKAKSILSDLDNNGKKVVSVLYDVNNDYFSKWLYPNLHFVSSKSTEKDLLSKAKIIEKRVFDKIVSFASTDFYILTAYFWFLDGVSGKYGKFSKETLNFTDFFFDQVKLLCKDFPKKTLFIVMGDHGHMTLKKNVVVNKKDIKEIESKSKAQFALDGRLMMFYSNNPGVTKKMFESLMGKNIIEIPQKRYFELLGGNPKQEVKKRIGNVIYMTKPHHTIRLEPKDKKATHGGLTKGEVETVFAFFMN